MPFEDDEWPPSACICAHGRFVGALLGDRVVQLFGKWDAVDVHEHTALLNVLAKARVRDHAQAHIRLLGVQEVLQGGLMRGGTLHA